MFSASNICVARLPSPSMVTICRPSASNWYCIA
jgi:hypothetical protein